MLPLFCCVIMIYNVYGKIIEWRLAENYRETGCNIEKLMI